MVGHEAEGEQDAGVDQQPGQGAVGPGGRERLACQGGVERLDPQGSGDEPGEGLKCSGKIVIGTISPPKTMITMLKTWVMAPMLATRTVRAAMSSP